MCRIKILISLISVVCILTAAGAQTAGEETDGQQTQQKTRTDAIFAEILQSLPSEAMAEIDSAEKTTAQFQTMQQQSPEEYEQRKGDAMEQLPEQLRRQVEKAIDKIESGAQQRQMEFMEQKQKESAQKNKPDSQ